MKNEQIATYVKSLNPNQRRAFNAIKSGATSVDALKEKKIDGRTLSPLVGKGYITATRGGDFKLTSVGAKIQAALPQDLHTN